VHCQNGIRETLQGIELLNKLKQTLDQARELAMETDDDVTVYMIDMAIVETGQKIQEHKGAGRGGNEFGDSQKH
jgi:hypothetical protein